MPAPEGIWMDPIEFACDRHHFVCWIDSSPRASVPPPYRTRPAAACGLTVPTSARRPGASIHGTAGPAPLGGRVGC